jgi:beta-lactamase superfamily II metal-dependent hydrolase
MKGEKLMKNIFKLRPRLITSILAVLFIASTIFATNQTQNNKSNSITTSAQTSTVDIHFIDTGNSDAILISDNGKNMLIDGAENDDEKLIVDYLNNLKIKKLDYLVLTHPDADHVGGLDAVVKNFDIGTIFVGNGSTDTKTYKDFLQEAINKNLKPSIPLPDKEFTLGNGKFKFYNMKSTAKDVNDRSLVTLYANGSNKFLFTGDAGADVEKTLPLKEIGKVDVLKVGHHGSKTSSSKVFIEAIKPTYGVICCGKDNKYGHPHKEVLDVLTNNKVIIMRTDLNGSIVMSSDGKKITAIASKSDTAKNSNTTTVAPTAPSTKVETKPSVSTNKSTAVYITKTGKKYHRDGCRSLSKSKIQTTIGEAQKKGLESCDVCKP